MDKTILLLLLISPLLSNAQWALVWSDEFNDVQLNTSNWTSEVGGNGWGNNELQYYTDGDNLLFNGSELIIEAREEMLGSNNYTSARITSKDKFDVQFGKIEARMRLPMGQGLWPAFWMLGANIDEVGWPFCGGIDVMQHVNNEQQIFGSMYWDFNGYAIWQGNYSVDPSDYHVYSVEWDELEIRWYVDDILFHQGDIADGINGTEEFQAPFFINLNLAVGGNWPGSPDITTTFPSQLEIDYVRVYKNELKITTTVCAPATEVRLTGPDWGWDPGAGPEAENNGNGTWTFTLSPTPAVDMEYLLVVDGVMEDLLDDMQNGGDCAPATDLSTYAYRVWQTSDPAEVFNTFGQCDDCDPSDPLTMVTEVCADINELRMTGSYWGWNPNGGPVATDNGDGTWTFTIDPGPAVDFEYLLIANGIQENLLDNLVNGGDCTPATDNATYAHRYWEPSMGLSVSNTYSQCTPCECETVNDCPTDLNGDQITNTNDLLIFLGQFGTFCN
jgi:beta-glucanase (GH16 family)